MRPRVGNKPRDTDRHRPRRPDAWFQCVHCRQPVGAEAFGTDHRNHCPSCLWSKHVDDRPGDRAAECDGAMEPIAVWVKPGGEWSIVHRCRRCAALHANRIAGRQRAGADFARGSSAVAAVVPVGAAGGARHPADAAGCAGGAYRSAGSRPLIETRSMRFVCSLLRSLISPELYLKHLWKRTEVQSPVRLVPIPVAHGGPRAV